ncbi:MAG: ATP-binding protein [Lentisphaerae bacterium]|nr:ATP-binding protein [Lentisphaerota bacterium]
MECVILIGIQASGKSTFCQERFAATHIRINLDMLKTRRREACFLKTCLETRQRFVVDNTNPTVADRARYIEPAKAAGFRVIGYYFRSTLDEALSRNAQREGKACIPAAGVRATQERLQEPGLDEGFDELFEVAAAGGGFVVNPIRDAGTIHP